MKIAIIGAGNIGSSLALGIRGKYQVVVTAKSEKTVSIMREKGFQVMNSSYGNLREVIRRSRY
jgi:prephenate dehydrogenase